MYTFNPGPAAVYPAVRGYLQDAFDEGWVSVPHRSERFTGMVRQTVTDLKAKLNIPQDYTVLFLSSATECWEVLTQSLTPRRSFHLYNGDFGKKWLTYAQAQRPTSTGLEFGLEALPDVNSLPFNSDETDLVCVTQNETSTATQLRDPYLLNLTNRVGSSLLAVDATSSMAGLNLKFIRADIWFASVQKCFGMPAGLSVLLLSPRAVARVREVNERAHYNSLSEQIAKMLNFQQTHTPNVLAIYVLGRLMAERAPIREVHDHLVDRADKLYSFFEQAGPLRPLIENPDTRSTTVLALQGAAPQIEDVRRQALEAGLYLGSGYGPLKATSLRIANFPAVPDAAMEQLVQLFAKL
ncbi:aminotransferase class V-fold PLP-dependent enzyme [uncultured Hymenobacter sp.]|uniref:aminotransferase class V-fold PLP-dependent enzyme n=1 Tax=uncultured Hymenobacter sp. TaxID=170016 RepID=UPI0035CB9F2A